MTGFTQRGFVACRKLGGGAATLKKFEVSASSNEAYFLGDAVILGASGKVRLLKNATATPPLGVISACYKSVQGRPFPFTFSQPDLGPFLTSGTAGFVDVNIDKDQTYTVQCGANWTQAAIGATTKVSAGAPNRQNGLSGQTVTGTFTTSSDGQWQVIGLAPTEQNTSLTSAAAPCLIEVIMNQSVYNGNPI